MKNKSLILTCMASAVVFGLTGVSSATSIGVKYTDSDGSTALTGAAGAPGYVQSNWTSTTSNGQNAPSSLPTNLVDSTGAASGVNVTAWSQTSGNSWALGDTASQNAILLNAFSDTGPSITFSNIGAPYTSGYSVVVYYSNNEGPTTGTLSVVGSAGYSSSFSVKVGPTANSSYSSVGFVQGTPTNTTTSSNYAVFSGLTDPGFTVSLAGGNDGIAAVQIVSAATPEPGTIGLLAVGSGMLLMRRRRLLKQA